MVAQWLVKWYLYGLYVPLTWFSIAYAIGALRDKPNRRFLISISLTAITIIFCVILYDYFSDSSIFIIYILVPLLSLILRDTKAIIPSSIRHLDILFFYRASKQEIEPFDTRLFFLGSVLLLWLTVFGIGRAIQPCEPLDQHLQISGCYASIETYRDIKQRVYISPDTSKIAIVRGSTDIEIGDVAQQDIVSRLRLPDGRVTSLAWSFDNRYLVAGTDARHIYVWEVAGERLIHGIPILTDNPITVAFAPNSYILGVTAGSEPITLWDATQGVQIRTISGHLDELYDLQFSPDGTLLAAAGEHSTRVFNLQTSHNQVAQVPGTVLGTWKARTPTIITHDYSALYVSTVNTDFSITNRTYNRNSIGIAGIFDNDQPFAIAGSFSYHLQGDTVWIQNIENGDIMQQWEFPRKSVDPYISPNNRVIALGISNRPYQTNIQLWHIRQP